MNRRWDELIAEVTGQAPAAPADVPDAAAPDAGGADGPDRAADVSAGCAPHAGTTSVTCGAVAAGPGAACSPGLVAASAAPGSPRRPAGTAGPGGHLTPAEAEAVLARLATHLVPLPTAADTEALIDRLRPLLPQPAPRRFRDFGLSREPVALLLRAQLQHFRPAWWLASLAFVLLGLLAGPSLAARGLSPAVLAPPLVIGGVLYGFRSLRGAALEIELSCPVTPAQVALGRMLVPLLYYLVLGAVAILPVPGLAGALSGAVLPGQALVAGSTQGAVPAPTGVFPEPAYAQLFLGWTAALLLFAGLMLTLTLYVGTATAAGLATVLWGLLCALHTVRLSPFALPAGPRWTPVQLALLALGLLLLATGLYRRRLFHWPPGREA